MEIKFVDTSLTLNVNGKDYTLDVGEVEIARKALAMSMTALNVGIDGDPCGKMVTAIDELFGQGTANEMLAGKSPTNDLAVKYLALSLGKAISQKRNETMTAAFNLE